jgi:peptide alpha-N-acetyltransferase
MQAIMDMFAKDLSEPYSIYTYRYFINNWPRLCVLVRSLLRGAFSRIYTGI